MHRLIAVALLTLALWRNPQLFAEQARSHQEIGKVSKIAPDSKNPNVTAITLSSHGHDFATIKADASIKVTKGTDTAALKDIVVGDNLKAVVDDDEIASSIEIKVPKKK